MNLGPIRIERHENEQRREARRQAICDRMIYASAHDQLDEVAKLQAELDIMNMQDQEHLDATIAQAKAHIERRRAHTSSLN